jgi:hypothetical protein
METTRIHRFAARAAAAVFAAVLPGASHAALDAEAMKQFGGTYSPECRNPAAPRATVSADTLTVVNQKTRITGGNVQTSYAYFGRSEPAGYQVALMSEVPGRGQLIFIVFTDKAGRYVTLSGEPKVTAALGKALTTQRFRLCAAKTPGARS